MIEEISETKTNDSESELETDKVITCQRDYRPTPYRDAMWEIVGESFAHLGFSPLELSVIATERARPDKMFEIFDDPKLEQGGMRWHGTDKPLAPEVTEQKKEDVAKLNEEELAAQFETGRTAGVEQGYQTAKQEFDAELAAFKQRFEALQQSVLDSASACFVRVEKEGIELALAVARKILDATVEARPEYIIQVIERATQALGASKPVRIRISPEDYEFISVVGLPPELSAEELGIQYVADEGIKSGCVVETNYGEVDLQLERMWEQIKENLFEAYR